MRKLIKRFVKTEEFDQIDTDYFVANSVLYSLCGVGRVLSGFDKAHSVSTTTTAATGGVDRSECRRNAPTQTF